MARSTRVGPSVSAGFSEKTVMSACKVVPQLAEDPLEDRLVAEVHAAVRAGDADAQSFPIAVAS